MDVKSAFLNGFIKEDVYVEQPHGFEDYKFPNHIYKLKKALLGLKQAPRSWYERLSTFLLEKDFERGKIVGDWIRFESAEEISGFLEQQEPPGGT